MKLAAVLFPAGSVIAYALLAGVLAGVAVAATPWGRQPVRFATAAVSTAAGFAVWYGVLDATHAAGFNVDAPVVAVSWADAGSGFFAFVFTAFALALVVAPRQPARQVVGSAALAGLVATVLDIFVL